MVDKKARFLQRYHNFTKAYQQFHIAIQQFDRLNDLEKEGLIQRFEYTFELAWKTMIDYLVWQNISVLYPREVIKTAFHYELIQDGELWMDMLEQRNLMAHTYDVQRFEKAIDKITNYYAKAIEACHNELGARR